MIPSILDFPTDPAGLIVRDGQNQLNDLLLGLETSYVLEEDPIESAEVRTSDVPRAAAHGSDVGDDWRSGLSAVWTLAVVAKEDPDCDDDYANEGLVEQIDDLGAALDHLDDLVVWARRRRHESSPRVRLVRPRRFAWAGPLREWRYGLARDAAIEIFAPDPRWYSPELHEQVLEVGEASGGWTFNWTFNWTFGGSDGGDTTTVLNSGRTPTPVVIEVEGPATAFQVVNLTRGEQVSYGVPVPDGSIVRIDSSTRRVTLDGADAYRNLTQRPDWLHASPGPVPDEMLLIAPGFESIATVRWRDAWSL